MVEKTKILNPKTDRWVFVGGPVYKKLQAEGYDLTRAKKKTAPVFEPPRDYTTTHQFQDYPVDRGTTLWRYKKPDRVGERRDVLAKCGKSCFMIPERLGFPICNKNPPPCEYNRKGINAAYVRARQWKYQEVAKGIEKLRDKLGLEASKKKKR